MQFFTLSAILALALPAMAIPHARETRNANDTQVKLLSYFFHWAVS